MIHITMKIYTKGGDKGESGLIGGLRVPKHHELIQTYGTVDELNAALGVARSEGLPMELDPWVHRVQNELFQVGADLATPWEGKKKSDSIGRLGEEPTKRLEQEIDQLDSTLPPLTQFILPGGSKCSAQLHFSRTICRRAEREVSKLYPERCNPFVLSYLNRLSDWIFVLARAANQHAGIGDTPWKSNT